MGWQDRDYGQSVNYGETPFTNPIMNLLFGSFPVGTWFGIRVRIHAMLLWFTVFQLLRAGEMGWTNVIISTVILFGMILLHEFGHCFGSRLVGGQPKHILLWPFGGLAYSDTPHRPWPSFVVSAFGPLVNVILAVVFGFAFYLLTHTIPPLNPFVFWDGSLFAQYYLAHPDAVRIFDYAGGRWLLWATTTNWFLLCFNLLPFYPLDGGSILQSILWKPMGFRRSMLLACKIGMVGAVLFGLYSFNSHNLFGLCLAIIGFTTCLQRHRITQMTTDTDDQYDLSAAWDEPDKKKSRKAPSRWNRNTVQKRAKTEQLEQAKIDAILDKVKEKGLHSLSWREKRTLKQATERQRQRDLRNRL